MEGAESNVAAAPAKVVKKSTAVKSAAGKKSNASTSKRHAGAKRDNLSAITNPAIRRIARRGGVKRCTKSCFDESRKIVVDFMSQIVNDAVTITEACKRKTVSNADVSYALKRNGHALYGNI